MSKKGNDKTSQGYCGWFTTWLGDKVYLRSQLEFIVAKWLDNKKFKYKLEQKIYNINGRNYKPDFFIYNNGLKYIIEVKYSKAEADKYIERFYDYFKGEGIKYFVLYKKHTNRIMKRLNLSDDLDFWKENSASIIHDMRGNKNPHYGFKQSDDSKKLIGLKTTERYNDITYRKGWIESIKNSMTDERKEIISKKMKERFKDPLERQKLSDILRKYDKKEIECICKVCEKKFTITECYDKITGEYKKSIGNKSGCCNVKCASINSRKKMVEDKKEKQIELYKKLTKKGIFLTRKSFTSYCKENGIGCDIRSTFGKFSKFKRYMEEYEW